MEKPDTGESWWSKLFGGGPSKPTPPPILPPNQSGGTTEESQAGTDSIRLTTTYDKNQSTMLNQLQEAYKYKSFIEEAAQKYGFQPSIICGIGSRESHWGLALKPPGPGGRGDFARRRPRGERRTPEPPDGPGYGRGLLQIDYDWHEFARSGKWSSPRDNILYGCLVLDQGRRFFKQQGLSLGKEQMLRAIVAAYNCGATATLRALEAKKDVDANTTGADYSKDVFSRGGWFQLHGWR